MGSMCAVGEFKKKMPVKIRENPAAMQIRSTVPGKYFLGPETETPTANHRNSLSHLCRQAEIVNPKHA